MRKTFIIIFIAISLVVTVPAQASEYSEYSEIIGDLMELINSEYVGGVDYMDGEYLTCGAEYPEYGKVIQKFKAYIGGN